MMASRRLLTRHRARGLRTVLDDSAQSAVVSGLAIGIVTAGVIAFLSSPRQSSGTGDEEINEAATSMSPLQPAASPWLAALLGGGITGATAWALRTAQRRPLRAAIAVAEAACAAAGGEADPAALAVDERLGPQAVAWNHLLARLHEHRPRHEVDVPVRGDATTPLAATHAAVVESLWLGLVVLDSQGRMTWLNRSAALVLGVQRDDVIGQSVSTLFSDPSASESALLAAGGQRPVKASADIPMTALMNGASDNGTIRISSRSLTGIGAVLVVEDISQLRLATLARDAFVAHATHELRTPLTNIRLYVEELMAPTTLGTAEAGRCLEVIASESRRLEALVADMLSVSEMEAGTMKLRTDDVRLDALLAELEKDFRAQAESKAIKLEFKLPPKLPTILGDRDKLYMTLTNLLGNAIKYTPESGTVTMTVRPSASDMRFEVADTGIGIAEAEQERVFESFYRANDTRIAKVTGTGLGLAVARQIARLHGGDITVSSVLDRGSTFVLTIPATTPQSMAA